MVTATDVQARIGPSSAASASISARLGRGIGPNAEMAMVSRLPCFWGRQVPTISPSMSSAGVAQRCPDLAVARGVRDQRHAVSLIEVRIVRREEARRGLGRLLEGGEVVGVEPGSVPIDLRRDQRLADPVPVGLRLGGPDADPLGERVRG